MHHNILLLHVLCPLLPLPFPSAIPPPTTFLENSDSLQNSTVASAGGVPVPVFPPIPPQAR
ncbi:hypothetical protein FIBSPDRAFT_865073 [Athelia psychrophila]|uniref:Secreted protein n=1 Tax=Athelia psychrophila TaxID=1759441 RepID=A0A166G2H0_9AGAM|nr:hypothetical protein FIBSPDRAFT_865073 [Fibularhizoctonia sp. CBS 109695]